MRPLANRLFSFAIIGLVGILPFFSKPPDPPEKAIKEFAEMFVKQDADGILKLMQTDVVTGTDLTLSEIENLLKRYQSNKFKFQDLVVQKKMKAEEESESAERVQVELTFKGPVLANDYPDPSVLKMVQLWILEKDKWRLERSVSMDYTVNSDQSYPSEPQDETAAQFEATLAVLDRLGLRNDEAEALAQPSQSGNSVDDYKELDRSYQRDKGPKGVDPKSESMQVFLKAAARANGGWLMDYSGDFQTGSTDKRKPVPWGMIKDYIKGAIELGKYMEKNGKPKSASAIYKRIISLGCQFLNEPGGYQFALWGLEFQRQGAEQVARVGDAAEKQKALKVIHDCSRKTDLLQTALGCLNVMNDYVSEKAAVVAAKRKDDPVFMPWGINTLAIFAVRGAPAKDEVCKAAGTTVLVLNPKMQKIASDALTAATQQSKKLKQFIEFEYEWIRVHNVYGLPTSR
jgi:hypothetical protein